MSAVCRGSDELDVYLRERASQEARKKISTSFILVEERSEISHAVATVTDNGIQLMLTYHVVAMPSTDIAYNVTICML